MRLFILSVFGGLGLVTSAAEATVSYSFATVEPFAGGPLAFSYDSEDFIETLRFVEAAQLYNATPSIGRVIFDPGCLSGGGSCSQLSVISEGSFGTTQTLRYFAQGAFSSPGTYAATFGAPATLNVSGSAAQVPEPSAWLLMIFGIGLLSAFQVQRARSRPAGQAMIQLS